MTQERAAKGLAVVLVFLLFFALVLLITFVPVALVLFPEQAIVAVVLTALVWIRHEWRTRND